MSELRLPPKMASLRPHLAPLVDDIEKHGPYAAILSSLRQGLQIEVDTQVERVTTLPPTAGTVVTACDGETLYEQAIRGFDVDDVAAAASDLSRASSFTQNRFIDAGPERRGDYVTPMELPPERLSIEEKLERCRHLAQRVQGRDKRIINVEVYYSERSEHSVFRNRRADLVQRVQRISLVVIVVAADETGTRRYDWESKTGTGGWELLHFTDEELDQLVANAVALLNAERIEPGEYTIITAPGVTGTICHESFGHGVETDMFLKERAKAAHYVDEVVGSPLVDIYDDPSLPGLYGSYYFDDEGWLAAPTQIVEEGIFRRGISDLYSATALGIPRTANGRRQDFTRKAYARMSNTFFGSGTTPIDDLFAQVDDGIYLEKWSSGMEDPQGWGIQVTCRIGREIKNGKLTNRLFSPVGLSGYVPDVLQSITAVSDVQTFEGGGCGKGHKELVVTSSGGPHLLLKARLS